MKNVPNRPRNPTGFVWSHPDTQTKRWQGVVKYPDPDKPGQWKTRSKTFERKADAQRWVDEALAEHRKNPQYRPPSEEAFGVYLSRWLTDVARARVRDTTWRAYAHAAHPLIDRLGAKPLKAVTPLDIQAVYTALLSEGRFQPATIRITHNVCRQALDDAVDWGLIPANSGAQGETAPRASARHSSAYPGPSPSIRLPRSKPKHC
ncbi:protein of unknown function [Candidatus Hydrogenisulfobacillus filiaventi]|uniref:Core-binding (CB) domain-containing protein n=1 Tax=Candidatus Hydrogenisulfobacillus filiaventi TaxID=2707344 RepID=A0A6F8ZFH2_9FIRM|nr:protein of unknown function [Candidatus Hydrogenisulfobacillus filiaventi]